MSRLRLLVAVIVLSSAALYASRPLPVAVHSSNNPANTTGRTLKPGSANGCGPCHGAAAVGTIPATLTSVSSLTQLYPGDYGNFRITHGVLTTTFGFDVAASDAAPVLSNFAAASTQTYDVGSNANNREVTHIAVAANYYPFVYTMPASATAGSAHTLYGLIGGVTAGGWNNATSLTITTKALPTAPATLTAGTPTSSSVPLSWSAGGPQYRVLAKTGSYPANANDGTIIHDGAGTSDTASSLTAATTYFFAAFSKDVGVDSGTSFFSTSAAQATATTAALSDPNPWVDAVSGNDANNGSSATPFRTIKQAILSVGPNGTIHVRPGTYNTTLGETFPITVPSGIKLKSTAGAASTIINATGANTRVIICSANFSGTLIEGFTITGGLYTATSGNGYGGGIKTDTNDQTTISRCLITGNEVRGAAGTGGVTAGGNGFGGGVDIDGTTTVINCVVRNNIARGGNGYTQPASGTGGAGGDAYGGGAHSFTSGTFLDNTFYANSSIAGNGGTTPVAGGGAGGPGGSAFWALDCGNCPVKNHIVANNVTTAGTGGTGSINGANGTAFEAGMNGAQPVTSYNLLFGNSVGDTNGGPNSVIANPLFINASDLHLRSASPARGAGTAAGTPTIDLDGNPRTSPPTIGAYEIGLFLTASAGIGRITVTWTGVSGASSYNLYMSQNPGISTFSFQRKVTGATSPFVLAPLANATWYFVITAIESGVEGPLSPEVSATTTVGAWGKALAGANFTKITRDLASGTTLYATANDAVGLYKSTDSGDSWTPLPGPYGGAMRAVAANGSNVLVAGAGSIYRSIDGGTSWSTSVSGAGIGEDFVASVAIDPLAPTNAYGGDFHITGTSASNLVAKSVDSGASFTNLNSAGVRAYYIQIDPVTAGTIYAAGSGTPNVAKSIDGGTNWSSASPVSGYPTALAQAPGAPLTLYIGMRDGSNSNSIGVYKTVNGGTSWTQMNTGLPSAPIPEVDAVLADSADANRVHAGTAAGYYFSTNGATNWSAGPAGGSYPSSTLLFNSFAQTSSRRLIGTTFTGIYMLALDPAPVVTAALSPNSGSSSGGTTVTITGTGFKSGVMVTFGVSPGTVTGSTSTSITVTSPAHPAGAGAVDVAVSNPDGQTVLVSNGFTYTVPVCSYSLGTTSASFTNAAGTSSVSVTASIGCAWSASSNDSFITVTSGSPGSGNGTVNYSVAANSGPARTGTMIIAGQTFTVSQDAAPGGTPTRFKGDFDGDGKSDILLRASNGDIRMWIMNGTAITVDAFVGSPGGTYDVAGIGDFNGDGKSDILLRDALGNIGMWLMNGPTIVSGGFVGSPGGYTVVGIGDFNGDGKADILLRDSLGSVGIWFMNGFTITSGAFVGSPGSSYSVAGVRDFNGDGKADILLRDSLGNLGMWIMNGAAITSGGFVGSPGGSYSVAGAGDFNGDGKADILLRDSLGNLGLWFMNGATVTSGGYVGSPGAGYSVATVNDYNGDGKTDIVLRDTAGNVGMWLMNGTTIVSGALVGQPGATYNVY